MTAALATAPVGLAATCDGLPMREHCMTACDAAAPTGACETEVCSSSPEADAACGTASGAYGLACKMRDVRGVCAVVESPGAIVKMIEEKLP